MAAAGAGLRGVRAADRALRPAGPGPSRRAVRAVRLSPARRGPARPGRAQPADLRSQARSHRCGLRGGDLAGAWRVARHHRGLPARPGRLRDEPDGGPAALTAGPGCPAGGLLGVSRLADRADAGPRRPGLGRLDPHRQVSNADGTRGPVCEGRPGTRAIPGADHDQACAASRFQRGDRAGGPVRRDRPGHPERPELPWLRRGAAEPELGRRAGRGVPGAAAVALAAGGRRRRRWPYGAGFRPARQRHPRRLDRSLGPVPALQRPARGTRRARRACRGHRPSTSRRHLRRGAHRARPVSRVRRAAAGGLGRQLQHRQGRNAGRGRRDRLRQERDGAGRARPAAVRRAADGWHGPA